MLLFLLIIYSISFLATALGISLFTKRPGGIIGGFVASMAIFIAYPFCLGVSAQQISSMLGDYALLNDICLIAIIESTVTIFLGTKLIRSHYKKEKRTSWIQVWRFPSFVLFILNGLLLVRFFYTFSGIPYFRIAVIFALIFFLILMAVSEILRWSFRNWDFRIELKSLIAFLQIILAMFLPLLVAPVAVSSNALLIDLSATVIAALVVTGLAGTGFILAKHTPLDRTPLWRFLLKHCI